MRDISPLGKAVILKLDRGLGCWHTVTDTDVRAWSLAVNWKRKKKVVNYRWERSLILMQGIEKYIYCVIYHIVFNMLWLEATHSSVGQSSIHTVRYNLIYCCIIQFRTLQISLPQVWGNKYWRLSKTTEASTIHWMRRGSINSSISKDTIPAGIAQLLEQKQWLECTARQSHHHKYATGNEHNIQEKEMRFLSTNLCDHHFDIIFT